MTAATAATPIREHLIDEHGYVAEALDGMGHNALVETHEAQSHPHRHIRELEARTAQIAATNQAAYEAACERYNDIASTYHGRVQALRDQIRELDEEWNAAAAELRQHEDHSGIPLYNRCAACTPGRALPAGHEGKCR